VKLHWRRKLVWYINATERWNTILISFIWKNKRKPMRSPCCHSLCVSPQIIVMSRMKSPCCVRVCLCFPVTLLGGLWDHLAVFISLPRNFYILYQRKVGHYFFPELLALWVFSSVLITAAVRSQAWDIFARFNNARNVGSNSTRGLLFFCVCAVLYR
jgi:hypothetical protein